MNKTAAALLAAFLLAPFRPLAADDDEPDIEVVVTAGRVAEDIEEVPASVSVITAEDLVASGQTTLVDALARVPGLTFRNTTGGPAQAEVAMRGFGENSHGRVLVMLNGRKLNRPDMRGINWLQIPVENVERVEVIRGPNSVMYGDHAVAGVINIITKGGSEELEISVSGTGGSFGLNRERVGVSGSQGGVKFSLSGEHTAEEGYRDRSAYRSIAGGASGDWSVGTVAGMTATLSYTRLNFELPGALWEDEYEEDPTQATNKEDDAQEQYLNADLGFVLGEDRPISVLGNLSYGLKLLESTITSSSIFFDVVIQTIAVTPRVVVTADLLGLPNRLTAGVDGYIDLMNVERFTDADRETKNFEMDVRKAAGGIYASNELSLFLILLSAGLRYDVVRVSGETIKTSGVDFDDSEVHSALVYDLGVTYPFGDGSKVYARAASVFRYPFTDEQLSFYGTGFDTFYDDLEPERGRDFEGGVELAPVPELVLAGSVYWLEMKDELILNPDTFVTENIDSRRVGVESSLRWSFREFLDIAVNYSYTVATFREGAFDGHEIPLVPNHTGLAEATGHLPFGFSLGVDATYQGESFFGNDRANDQERLDDYWLVGCSLRFRTEYVPKELEAFVAVDNLFDETYATQGFYQVRTWPSYDYSYYPGRGRSWRVGASWRY
jgi:iron complex outermembrane receptor protein